MDGAVVGVNPHNGDLQWRIPFKADYSIAVATPVWGPDNLLFVSAEYNAGAKVIQLERSGLQTKVITLDQDGNLMIAHPSTQGFKISAKAPVLTRIAWTPPVLVGTRLYIRDRRSLMAVDLS